MRFVRQFDAPFDNERTLIINVQNYKFKMSRLKLRKRN
jgi:hypothetical protein